MFLVGFIFKKSDSRNSFRCLPFFPLVERQPLPPRCFQPISFAYTLLSHAMSLSRTGNFLLFLIFRAIVRLIAVACSISTEKKPAIRISLMTRVREWESFFTIRGLDNCRIFAGDLWSSEDAPVREVPSETLRLLTFVNRAKINRCDVEPVGQRSSRG